MAPQARLQATPRTFGVVGAHVLVDIVRASTLYFVPSPQIAKPFHNRTILTPLRREEQRGIMEQAADGYVETVLMTKQRG